MHTLVIHAHCYQPPREDPWLELVDAEPSAAPDHDWNARIDRECYARLGATEVRAPDPRAAARDPDARGGLARIVNLYAWCSFDVGPTLCEWMDRSSDTFALMREGDAASFARLGHGNAIAAPFHHVILPLASRRDKITEVRWGIADFRRRFGREPEGMWLPECAVDEETLEVVALEGIRFTILAPYQIRTTADHHGLPVRWKAGGSRELAILPYDGALAGDVAFGGLLRNAAALAHRFTSPATEGITRCTTLATDGETFGHHHRSGESTLADALSRVMHSATTLSNAAAVVANHRDLIDAELVSPSSWSCAHGVERWRSDCGCRLDGAAHTSQRWRRPLREVLEKIAARCHDEFEREGQALFARDPWDVRNDYGSVVATTGSVLESFVREQLAGDASVAQLQRARELLELERAVMRTFTSCAWFFDDVARIEVRQVLRYAARALELSGKAARLTPELIAGLEHAASNASGGGTGADLFVREAMPHRTPLLQAAAGIAAMAAAGYLGAHANVQVSAAQQSSPPADIGRDAGGHGYHLGAYSGVVRDASAHDANGECVLTLHVVHGRSGEHHTVVATVRGAGASITVAIDIAGTDAGATEHFTVRDLPESAARLVLRQHAADATALH